VSPSARARPRATYRVQLQPGFTLDDAAAIVPYLSQLGVSHLYASPILQARQGSTHGYDTVDHGRVNHELGGEAAFRRVTDALRRHGMGLVLDIVPNHMAIGEDNRWWWDVLQHGRASRYADYFDVDWDPPESGLHNVVLLPVLADHGAMRLVREGGSLLVQHAERRFPVDLRSTGALVSDAASRIGSDELGFIGSALSELPRATTSNADAITRRQRDAEVLTARLAGLLAEPTVSRALDMTVADVSADPHRLARLLEQQNYRLAPRRAGVRVLGCRIFFDIDELIGLRMERPEVFRETHRLVLEWVAQGLVDGLRVDHPDGLRDPSAYFARLREAAPNAWIVAEKILAADEPLPTDWPIDGTTGYGFATLSTGVMVDPAAEPALTQLWDSVADVGPGWRAIEEAARAEVLSSILASDLNRLTELFVAVCEANRRYRDFTRHELHDALREVAARLPVYRTYATGRGVGERDAVLITGTVAAASDARPDLDPELFAFLGSVLRLGVPGQVASELAMRFQQLTPAAMAKGVEDTGFYRHHRLVALNEVGGDPGRFGLTIEAFHAALASAQRQWPDAMLTLSTHDTKRSADVRARIALLSQDPGAWRRDAQALTDAASPHRTGEGAPSAADTYLFFQTVVGAWPIEADRAVAYLEKATREAKLHTSWTAPDAAYDAALAAFVRGSLADRRFRAAVESAVARLADAWQRSALAQLAIQLTAPGVPDIYQGTELWDLSLVDPDNRRAVDYDQRRRLLEEVGEMTATTAWDRRNEGLPKLWLLCRALGLRRRRADALSSSYEPLAVHGPLADAVIAFARGSKLVTVVPRHALRAERAGWSGATVDLPPGSWTNLDGSEHAGGVPVADLFDRFPVAILEAVA
jgi:(1->4)-alpha-D-glucan 1-alpha-D-glucosylmutase